MKDRHRAITKIRKRHYSEVDQQLTKASKIFAEAGITTAQLARNLVCKSFGIKKKTISQLKKKNKRW